MKFAVFILNHIIPEWALMYLNYKAIKAYLSTSGALKDFLLYAKKTKSPQEYKEIKKIVMEKTYIISKIIVDQKEFNKKFIQELSKIKFFVNAKYNDLKGKTYKIQLQILSMNRYQRQLERSKKRSIIRSNSQVAEELTEQLTNQQIKMRESDFNQKGKKLKELCFQLYNEGVNFEKYLKINQEAIRKIMKKQNKKSIKLNQEQINIDECKKLTSELDFDLKQNKVKQLLFQVEKYLLKHFYQTKQKLCKEQLRKYQFQNDKNNKAWFQFGLFTGFSLMLMSFIIFLATQKQLDILTNTFIYESFPIYRGALLFILYYWSLTIVIHLWNLSKINYKLYFSFNHHFSTINEQLKRVMTLTSIFLLVSLFYLCDVSKLGIIFSKLKGEEYFPLIIWASLLATVAFPSKSIINGKGRMWLYRNLLQSLNPKRIEQRHFFIMSQFTSLIIPFTDLTYTICEYSKGISNQEENDNNQYDECFFISRYFTLALVLFPYFILIIQIIFLTQKQQNIDLYFIEFIRNILSIALIIFATLSYQEPNFFYYWLGMAIFIGFLNIIFALKKWSYLDIKLKKKKKQISYKQKLIILYLPFGIIQPLSISSSIFGCLDRTEQHSLLILYIGIAELIRRMIINYYIVDAEHFRNKQKYQTVGEYEFPFEECCTRILLILFTITIQFKLIKLTFFLILLLLNIIVHLTNLLISRIYQYQQYKNNSYYNMNLRIVIMMRKNSKDLVKNKLVRRKLQQIYYYQYNSFCFYQIQYKLLFCIMNQNQIKGRTDIGLFIQGKSTFNQFNNSEDPSQTQVNQLKISELIVKDSEKALGDSFINYDINNFKPDELKSLINCQQISESDLQSLHINNKNSKKEIDKLYEEFGIKIKK